LNRCSAFKLPGVGRRDRYRRSYELLDELVPRAPLGLRLRRERDQLGSLPQLAPTR
jgi:hypothetical protein